MGEQNQQLFFTVQVGVYNKPITNNQLTAFDDLVTFKTDKGQIRYSSGMFENSNDAKIHRNKAVAKGVNDAYVVAYYQGKRITIAEANNLLAKNGPDILKKSVQLNPQNLTNIQNNGSVVNVSMKLPEIKRAPKPDSLIQFSVECNGEAVISKLEKLNRIGIFTYQAENGKIVSAKMKKDEVTNIEKEYFKEFQIEEKSIDSSLIIQLDVSNQLSNGSLIDWLLRSEMNYRVHSVEEQKTLSLYLDYESQRDFILKKADELSISIINQ
jgi:hypothetical protein